MIEVSFTEKCVEVDKLRACFNGLFSLDVFVGFRKTFIQSDKFRAVYFFFTSDLDDVSRGLKDVKFNCLSGS